MTSFAFVGESRAFETIFDFDGSPAHALQVNSFADFKSGEFACLSSNAPASIYDRAEEQFNGVAHTAQGESYFMLNYAGLVAGRDQSVLMVTVTAGSKTLMLSKMYARSRSNSGLGYITVSVASKTDLSDSVELCSYPADDSHQSLTFQSPVAIPPGLSRIFILRADTTNPDNTRYMVHRKVLIAGTVEDYDIFRYASAVRLILHADKGALVSLKSKDGVVDGDLSSSGSFWTVQPALDQTGYILSTDDNNFMAAEEISVDCRGPAIPLTKDISRALVVMPQLNTLENTFSLVKVGTQLAVTYRNFAGCMGSLQPLHTTNNPDAGVYQHWELSAGNVQLYDGWTKIGTGMTRLIFALNDEIFAVQRDSGAVLHFVGDINTWEKISDAVVSVAGNNDGLYVIPVSGDKVMKYVGVDGGGWTQMGGNIALRSLTADTAGVLGLDALGRAYRFDDTSSSSSSPGWVDLHSPSLQEIVWSGPHICGLTLDRSTVLMFDNTHSSWIEIGSAMMNLVAAGNALYAVDTHGALHRYYRNSDSDTGTASASSSGGWWGMVSDATTSRFTAKHSHVYKTSSSSSSSSHVDGVYMLSDVHWNRVGGSVDTLTVGDTCMLGLRGCDAYLFGAVPSSYSSRDVRILMQRIDRNNPAKPFSVNTLTVTETRPWTLSFHTLDEMFAGFDGKVTFKFIAMPTSYMQRNQQPSVHEIVLSNMHFERAAKDFWIFRLSTGIDDLQFLEICTDNWWGDQWHLGYVRAFCPSTNKQFTLTFNCTINQQSSKQSPSRAVATSTTKSLNFADVRLWKAYDEGRKMWYVNTAHFYVANGPRLYMTGEASDRCGDDVVVMNGDQQHVHVQHLDIDSISEYWKWYSSGPYDNHMATPRFVYDFLYYGGALQRLTLERQAYYARLLAGDDKRRATTIEAVQLFLEVAQVKL